MKHSTKILGLTFGAFLIGAIVSNFAISNELPKFKVATVDVQKVVSNSNQVNVLKEEQNSKLKELNSFVEKAKADVAAVKDITKQKELETKYNTELNVRKNALSKDYVEKLAVINKNISDTISQKAKEMNYNVVLSKGIVLYGGDDITETVSKSVN